MSVPVSIGKEKAIEMYNSGWWKNLSAHQIAVTGLSIRELCLPFNVLHEALENALGRPVYTHEIGLAYNDIMAELLDGKEPPTNEAIISLIPEEKRIVISK